jgi:hypothetical protein
MGGDAGLCSFEDDCSARPPLVRNGLNKAGGMPPTSGVDADKFSVGRTGSGGESIGMALLTAS